MQFKLPFFLIQENIKFLLYTISSRFIWQAIIITILLEENNILLLCYYIGRKQLHFSCWWINKKIWREEKIRSTLTAFSVTTDDSSEGYSYATSLSRWKFSHLLSRGQIKSTLRQWHFECTLGLLVSRRSLIAPRRKLKQLCQQKSVFAQGGEPSHLLRVWNLASR